MNPSDTYNLTLLVFAIIAAVVFLLLFKIRAPYGRHSRTGWGSLVPNRIAWIIMESPAAIIPVLIMFISGRYSPPALILLFIWECHYIHRSFIFPLLMRKGAPMAMAVMFSGVFFNLCNGLIQGLWIFIFSSYTVDLFSSPSFIAGTCMFVTGMAINIQSDKIVRNLRKGDSRGYKIPYGGMFKFVSAPNYLGEIVEWIGWACLTWSLPGILFAFWTIANLAPRARANHMWYLEKFPDYPDRKILLPKIW